MYVCVMCVSMYVCMYVCVVCCMGCQKERGGLARRPQVPKYDKLVKRKIACMCGWRGYKFAWHIIYCCNDDLNLE